MAFRWPRWFDENKRFCPSKSLVKWLKRVTGFGSAKLPPLPDVHRVDIGKVEKLEYSSDELVKHVETLERELIRSGRVSRFWPRGSFNSDD